MDDTSTERRFRQLVAEWRAQYEPTWTMQDMVCNSAYLRIIGIGREALPLLVRELRRNSGPWFTAMYAIAGEDAAAGETTVPGARAAWLRWAERNGYAE